MIERTQTRVLWTAHAQNSFFVYTLDNMKEKKSSSFSFLGPPEAKVLTSALDLELSNSFIFLFLKKQIYLFTLGKVLNSICRRGDAVQSRAGTSEMEFPN